MSESKKYFYLKLKDNFFSSEEMLMLESLPDGLVYQNIYLRMCLLSLKNDGALTFKNMMPYDLKMLSTVLRIDIAKIKMAIELFVNLGLVEKTDNEVLFMSDIQTLIGRSSTEAERIANYRKRIAGCTKGVQMYGNCTPKKEIELEKEIKIEKELDINEHLSDNGVTLLPTCYPDVPKQQQQKRFIIPSVEEIAAYCRERNNTVDAQHFFDYYESKGWVVGKVKMKDWRATVRNWERTEKKFEPAQKMQKREQLTDEEYRADCDDLDNITY